MHTGMYTGMYYNTFIANLYVHRNVLQYILCQPCVYAGKYCNTFHINIKCDTMASSAVSAPNQPLFVPTKQQNKDIFLLKKRHDGRSEMGVATQIEH